ncbi:MAG TPA: DUF2149 domain-containing protein [Methanothrix soehngenii]|nr:DUF2149 domain-containing protein [Methanothrix soehngenii]
MSRTGRAGRRSLGILDESEDDPMSGVANLFDAAMVFAIALLLALVISYNIPELLQPEASVTIVKNPGDPNMQIIIKNMDQIQILNMTDRIAGGQGTKMGTAYRLENGMVVYVPENATAAAAAAAA